MAAINTGDYGADDDLADYILGITFEIWEAGNVDLINQYYGLDTIVWALDGITDGASEMITGTNAMLQAFPDRLLLGDDVICNGNSHNGYSSHRVLSPMTNSGTSLFGPATVKQVRISNIADCVVEEGVITREWLARDNLALVRQLGFDPRESAELVASNRTKELDAWFSSETQRLDSKGFKASSEKIAGIDPQEILHANWISGDEAILDSTYAEYAVLHRSPVEIISGRAAISRHYSRLRGAFDCAVASVDHTCVQTGGKFVDHMAVRWAVCGTHTGDFLGIAATGRSVYIMGITHSRIVSGRIAVEWTVFDSLGVMAQLL